MELIWLAIGVGAVFIGAAIMDKLANAVPSWVDRIIQVTVINETGGGANRYSAVNPNDAGHGMSWGILQFNQGVGGLPQLLRAMYARDSARFNATFGQYAGQILQTVGNGATEAVRLTLALGKAPYRALFEAAGRDPVWQEVQRAEAYGAYLKPLLGALSRAGIVAEKQIGMIFDVSVNQGVGRAAAMISALAATPKTYADFVYTATHSGGSSYGDVAAITARLGRVAASLSDTAVI